MLREITLAVMLCAPECSMRTINISGIGTFTILSGGAPERIVLYNVQPNAAPSCQNYEAFSQVSIAVLSNILATGNISVERIGNTFNGAILAVVKNGKHDIGDVLLDSGYAVSPSSSHMKCR